MKTKLVVSARITKRFTFEAAHYLPLHKGLCKNTHGHRWILEVCIEGRIDKKTGMVLDYTDLKEIVKSNIIDKFDHSMLNDWFENPTSENIAGYIFETLFPLLEKESYGLDSVKLWETETSHCEVTREDTINC